MKTKTHIISLIILFVVGVSSFAQDQEESTYAPQIKTFANSPDLLGTLSNSVNLFSGQVNLPLNLVSLPGRNGLDVNVSIFYNSNVDKVVSTWNLEAPTGVLGLGWALNIPQIIADNKQTGTREDDEFYFVENGTSNKLICTEINGNTWTFEGTIYSPWKISYSITDEKWTIIREDGTKYIYGDANSNRQTVQYVVRWGNWIGSTSESGGELQAFIWNLSEISDIWGETICFHYESKDTMVISNNVEYTEASYLKKIVDIFQREIEFYYSEKETTEYQDPHTEQSEPDAYQERYEKKRLDSLHIKDRNGSLLSAIHFTSTLVNHDGITKRYLTSIIQKNNFYEESLPLKFIYNETANNYGALIQVETPTGGKIVYTYGNHEIEYSQLNGIADAPSAGYKEPRVFIHENYVVITWRYANPDHSEGYRNAIVQIWEWDGKWINALSQSIGMVKLINKKQDFSVTLQDDFFAILTAPHEWNEDRQCHLYTFTKNPKVRGKWTGSSATVMSNSVVAAQLRSGKDFISVKYSHKEGDYIYDYLRIFKKSGQSWLPEETANPLSLGPVGTTSPTFTFNIRNIISANNNFLLLYTNQGNPDKVKICYYTGDDALTYTDYLELSGVNNQSAGMSYLHSNNSSLLLFSNGTNEYIFSWDQDYNNLDWELTLNGWPDDSPVNSTNNGYFINKADGWRSKVVRRSATQWYDSWDGLHKPNAVTFGDDFFLWTQQGGSEVNNVTLRTFNPNNNSWSDYTYEFQDYQTLRAGNIFFTMKDKIYNRQTNGTWLLNSNVLINPTNGIDFNSIRHGINFTAYHSYGPGVKTYYVPLENGNPLLTNYSYVSDQYVWHYLYESFVENKSELVGNNTIVTYSSTIPRNHFHEVTSLNLYKIINDEMKGRLTKYFVKGFEIFNGETSTPTAIHYYPDYGILDPSGSNVQYNKVRVIPGGSVTNYNSNIHPNGYTDSYFFNGLSNSEVALQWPSNIENVTNASDYYKILTGSVYETRIYDEGDILKSSIINYWFVYEKAINYDTAYYYRQMKREEMIDNVNKVVENTYENDYGLIKENKTYNYNGKGEEESIKTEYKYGYEAYSALLTNNVLTPIIQTKSWIDNICTGISVSTMEEWTPGKWGYHKSYVNKIYETNDFDFDNWSGSNEPAGTIWLKTSEIKTVNSNGEVLETMDVEGNHNSVAVDLNGVIFAKLSNTNNSQYLADNFDDLNITYYSPLPWLLEGNWQIASNGVLKHNGINVSTSARPSLGTTQIQSNFIAEFDIRIEESYNTSDWGGFQFRKVQNSDDAFTSGYTVFLRKNGNIELYKPNITLGSSQITTSSRDWHRITVVADAYNIKIFVDGIKAIEVTDNTFNGQYIGFFSHRANAEFDNLILHPKNTFATFIAYDAVFGTVKSIYRTGKEKIKYAYDSFQRKIGEVGPGGIPLSSVSSSLSLDRNTNYLSTDPNVSLQTMINGTEGYYDDFETAYEVTEHHLGKWAKVDGSSSNSDWEIEDGKLKHTNSAGGSGADVDQLYLDLGYELTGIVGIEFSVKTSANASDLNFGVAAGDEEWDVSDMTVGSTVWTYFYGYSTWRNFPGTAEDIATYLKPNKTYRLKIILNCNTQTLDFYVDGKPQLNNRPFRESTDGIQKISFLNYGAGNATQWLIDDLMLYTEPSHTVVYSDGAGRSIQTQTEEENNKILVTETLYDDLNRAHIQTKTTEINSWLGFRPDFVEVFYWTTGSMTGEVQEINNDSFPYSRTVFETSPLSRVVESSKPGADFKIGSGHTVKSYYYNNSSSLFPGNFPNGEYFVTEIENADGVSSYVMKDKLGNVIGSKSGPVKGNGTTLNSCGVDENNPTDSFTPTLTQEANYNFENYDRPYAFKVGTTPGGSQILNLPNSSIGSFTITQGLTYYLTLDGGPESSISQSRGNLNDSDPIASAVVQYNSITYDADIYPTVMYDNSVNTAGSINKSLPPNYFNPPYENFDPSDFITESKYNILGQLKEQINPDITQPSRYIYDQAGRLRFSIDANGAAQNPDNILYVKYDNLGRVIEKGYTVYDWNESQLQNYADTNPGWPSTPATWRKKYYYRGFEDNTYEYGELVKVEVNNNSFSTAEVIETYTFNKTGDIINVKLELPGEDLTKDISYTYNNTGQTETIQYLPYSLTISNVTISNTQTHEAANNILVGPAVTIQSGGNLTLRAGNEIRLLPGFTALSGSQLSASIGSVGGGSSEAVTVVYTYDRVGRVKQIGTTTDPDFFAAYTYNVNGALNEEKLNNNSLTRTMTYNTPGWLTTIDDQLFKEEISYTSGGYGGAGYYNGNISKLIFTDKSASSSYNVLFKYDNLGRMQVADNNVYDNFDLGVGTGNEIKFDANGNLVFVKEGSTTRNYKYFTGTNSVKNTNGTTTEDYTYDSNGNIDVSNPKELNLFYDAYFNLADHIASSLGQDTDTYFEYGSNSERVFKNTQWGGGNYHNTFYVRGLNDYPLMEKNYFDSQGSTTCLYVYGPTGLIAINDYDEWNFLIKDHLGSTRIVFKGNNEVVSKYHYSPFGGIMYSLVNLDAAYQFTGQEFDDEIGLHNFRARLYDSDLAMFYAVDPAGQNFSPFGYAGNNPVINIDKDGKFYHLIIGALIGGFANALFRDSEDFGWNFLVGAISGAIGAGVGMGITSSLAGSYSGAGGSFWGGFVGTESAMSNIAANFYSGVSSGLQIGAGSGLAAGFFNGTGNALVKGEDFGDALLNGAVTGGIGALSGGIIGGIGSGIEAAIDGRNFWYGDRLVKKVTVHGFPNLQQNNNTSSDCAYYAAANIDDVYGSARSPAQLKNLGPLSRDFNPSDVGPLFKSMGYSSVTEIPLPANPNIIYNALTTDNSAIYMIYKQPTLSYGHAVVVNGISIYNSGRSVLSLINSWLGEPTSMGGYSDIIKFLYNIIK